MREICKKSSWPQGGVILFQAARLTWQNSSDPKGDKGKAELGPLWASHLAAWQHTPIASAVSCLQQSGLGLGRMEPVACAEAHAIKETWRMWIWHFQLL